MLAATHAGTRPQHAAPRPDVAIRRRFAGGRGTERRQGPAEVGRVTVAAAAPVLAEREHPQREEHRPEREHPQREEHLQREQQLSCLGPAEWPQKLFRLVAATPWWGFPTALFPRGPPCIPFPVPHLGPPPHAPITPKPRTGTLMWPNECEKHSPGGVHLSEWSSERRRRSYKQGQAVGGAGRGSQRGGGEGEKGPRRLVSRGPAESPG